MNELLLVILIILFSGFMIYKILNKNPQSHINKIDTSVINKIPKIEISLDELAQNLWLKYNETVIKNYYEMIESSSSPNNIETQKNTLTNIETNKTTSHSIELISSAPNDLDTSYPTLIEMNFQETLKNDEPIYLVWKEYFLPYSQQIKEQKVDLYLKEGLNILSKEGNCSSLTGVSTENKQQYDVEIEDFSLYKDLLSKVSLKEHTLNVIRIISEDSKKIFENSENHMPKVLFLALFHDIGKIPNYFNIDPKSHSLTSASVLNMIAEKLKIKPFWFEEAIQVIREHHISGSKNIYKKLLRGADKKARLIEISRLLSDYTIKPLKEWFSLDEFLRDLYNTINIDHYGPKWYAFHYNDIIYVKPDRALDLIDEQRKRKKVLSYEFLTKNDRQKAITFLLTLLEENEMLAYELQKEDNSINLPKFRILIKDGKTFNINLIPIKISIYEQNQIKELKRRLHSSYFSNIEEVKLIQK